MSFWQEKLYPNLPIFAQNWAISAYGYSWYRRRFGGIFNAEYKKFKERENFSSQQWLDYQTLELRKLLCHAFETVPYYNYQYSKLGFNSSKLKKFELHELNKLPFLEKDDLRKYGTTTLLSTKREKSGTFFSSSGSTGTPVMVFYSLYFHQRISAALESRVRNWAGVESKDARGMIGGRRILQNAKNNPPYYRYNTFEKQTYFSAYHISRQNAKNYLEGMLKNKVQYMTGYAMSNYFLASFFSELGMQPPMLKVVITSSEKLKPAMRKTFEKVYGCKTFDSYSGVENCGLISENAMGELVGSPDVGIMEIIKDNSEPALSGEEGEVIFTGLLNFDQPLIRYKIGDRVRLAKVQNSKTGMNMPIVEEIVGRTEDIIHTKDGRLMVRFHGIFTGLNGVIEGQIIQHDYENYTVKIIPGNSFSKNEEEIITTKMKSQLGNVGINILQVDEIPRTASGKFKAVISELKNS